jgi:hypothetical protein
MARFPPAADALLGVILIKNRFQPRTTAVIMVVQTAVAPADHIDT